MAISTECKIVVYNSSMSTISVLDIQRDPIAFLRRVEAGETLVLLRDDRPLAEIKPLQPPSDSLRPYGLSAGEFTVPADFDEPLPEDLLKEFEGH
jgi:antitoxin (DNA-binding transcriptional repressor) of toxin-antitoxin stability system